MTSDNCSPYDCLSYSTVYNLITGGALRNGLRRQAMEPAENGFDVNLAQEQFADLAKVFFHRR